MSYLVLARKYRPQAFDHVTGQEHVVRTLANAIASDRVAHAFLLCGPRGVGKTTTARLLARALNCAEGPTATPCGTCLPCKEIVAGASVDVVEIDGASNNGVDNVRELRETARYLPQRDKHKIFIIDEVHMLSVAAFNALLKTLEEPPPHVKFIFATTDPQKLPDTILSRCQRHNFRRVPEAQMVERLRFICEQEGIRISDRALQLVARQADGGMRDSLSLLDQLLSSAGTEIDDAVVEEALGLVDRTVVHGLADALLDRDGKKVVEIVASVYDRGIDAKRLCEELATHLRDLVYVKSIGSAPADRGDVEQRLLVEQAGKADVAQLTRLFDRVHHAIRELTHAPQPRLALEVALLSAVHLAPAQGLADLAARLEAVAASLGAGAGAGAMPGPAGRQMQPPAAAPQRPAPQAQPPRPSPQRQAPAMSTADLLQQVEALTRQKGTARPRQAGARPAGRGTPPAGSDEEPHGASVAGQEVQGRPPFGPGGPQGGVPPQPAGPGMPQQRPPMGGPGSPPQQGGPMGGPGAPQQQPPMNGPGTSQQRPGSGMPDALRAAIARRMGAPAPVEMPDDEPPPPGDEDAPVWADEDPGFADPDVRPLPKEALPGGCATRDFGKPDPAPPRQQQTPPRPASVAAATPQPAPSAPARQAGPSPAAAGQRDDPTAEVHARWRAAVEGLRRENALVGACLSEGRLIWLRQGEVALGFEPDKAFHREQLRTTLAGEASRLLQAWFGGPTRLVLQEADPDAPVSVAEQERRAREERRVRLREEAREHPAVLAVQSILGGEIDEIEVLEER